MALSPAFPTDITLDSLRRDAKALKKAHAARAPGALERLKAHVPRADLGALKHADFLHVIAREHDFESWPRLKLAAETIGMDRAARQQRLKVALFHGHGWAAEQLLDETPDLADGLFGLQCALYDRAAVVSALARDPGLAVQTFGPRRPILHLAFSKWIKQRPDLEADMLAVAEALKTAGADVNDGYAAEAAPDRALSALYGALGHSDNMVLARWFLDHRADPNDGESLYHATELGHHDGLRMLLAHGADPKGTNALLRAMDFDDVAAVRMLLEHGAQPDDFDDTDAVDVQPWTIPALHHAARRGSGVEMVALLLEHGADPARPYQGVSAYSYARVHGNRIVADAIEERGAAIPLTREEKLLAQAADGDLRPGIFIDPDKLPEAYRTILRQILHLPGRLDHIRRLVGLGVEYDGTDSEGLTPVQVAGWSGLPEVLEYFLSLRPDLSHVNGYGGTLLSTIIHGSENNLQQDGRDYLACLELALRQGVALPRKMIGQAGREDVAAFLEAWAEAHPGQVV
ncbi:ankyrin repeat domain-containing protein [Puniceibacterium sediminis]|uniref:Ankyrin repeat n=1 Tax=Puniceibacterium sediminis TaxID=1608407 RepID=A0A238UUZ8_9RHOB|nr:ankyrin repeat domain-containing protein [Puniceibacterium sediminis]SNR25049.1 Ankyrin repeat [Puniceibacterium sediminis]